MTPSPRRIFLAASLLLTFYMLFLHVKSSAPPANPPGPSDFSTIDGLVFEDTSPLRRPPAFHVRPFGDAFSVQEDPVPATPALRYSLYARLTGPDDEKFGCYLSRWPNGTHVCLEAASLPPGDWRVNVTLVRSTTRKRIPDCAVPAAALLRDRQHLAGNANNNSKSNTTFSIVDYVLKGNFTTFKMYRRCFRYPYERVTLATWTKKASKADLVERNINLRRPGALSRINRVPLCSGPGGAGRWVPYKKPCVDSELCSGSVDEIMMGRNFNRERGLHHIFIPFTCRPRLLNVEEATSCACQQGLTLAGDSRTLHLAEGLKRWVRGDAVQFIALNKPYRLGLRHALAGKEGEQLREIFRSGQTVIINSVLHDVAEFYSTTTVVDVFKSSWRDYTTCPASCIGKLALRCNCRKQRSIEAFFESLQQLRDEIASAKKEAEELGTPHPRVYWMSLHKRPPYPPDVYYDWQTADVVRELETAAAAELSSVGVGHIDLRWLTVSAPGHWWDDPVHFGKNKDSWFLHSILQAILSHICPFPA